MAGFDEFVRSITGDNAVINTVVLDQGSGEYTAVPVELTAEQVAELRSDPHLAGRELSPAKLDDVLDNVNSRQLYYSFDDFSDAVMGRYNNAVTEALTKLNEINDELPINKDPYDTQRDPVGVHDINGINAIQQGVDTMIDMDIAEARAYGVDQGLIDEARELAEELGEAHALADQTSRTWFSYDKVPAPGMEYQEPDYDQFRAAAPEGTAQALEPVLPE